MSYERQRYVTDGDVVIFSDDRFGRAPTRGTLVHGADASGEAHPIRTHYTHELATLDLETKEILTQVLMELRKMNLHLLSITDEQISEPDIDSNY